MSRRPVIAVVGGAAAGPRALELARETGAALCRAGCHLLCGGRGGVMEAACRGFREAREAGRGGGLAIGLLPGPEPDEANPYVDLPLATGLGIARNAVIVRAAAGVIAIGGGSGTLSEIAMAWQLGRPVVPLSGSGGWADRLRGESLDDKGPPALEPAETPEEAVLLVLAALRP